MFQLLPGYLLGILACVGAGSFFWRPLQNQKQAGSHAVTGGEVAGWIGVAGLLGIACLACLLGIFGIFLPISKIAILVTALFSIVGILQILRMAACSHDRRVGVCFLLLVVFTLFFSARPVLHGDTGNYHHQAVLWMSGWQLPFGLANLHGRFGFNSSWWAFSALFEFPWAERGTSIYYPVGLLCFFFGCLFFSVFGTAWAGKPQVSDVILLAALYLWFRQITGINNPSFSTDAPANLLLLASGWGFAKWRESGNPDWFSVWCVLAATAATFKLTALPWLAASALAAAVIIAWNRVQYGKPITPYVLPAAAGLMIFFTYAARGILISGFPFYPTKLLGLGSLGWAVPERTIVGDTDGIRNWPTRGGTNGAFEFAWNWIQNQLGLTNIIFGLLVITGISIAFAVLARRVGTKKIADTSVRYLPLLAASGAGFIVCFAYAPALRFMSGYFFLLIGILLGVALANASPDRAFLRAIVALLLIGGTGLNLRGALDRKVEITLVPSLPEPAVKTHTTKQGEPIRVNQNGFSWAALPPATPYFNENLRILRSPDGVIRTFESQLTSTQSKYR